MTGSVTAWDSECPQMVCDFVTVSKEKSDGGIHILGAGYSARQKEDPDCYDGSCSLMPSNTKPQRRSEISHEHHPTVQKPRLCGPKSC